MYCVFKAAELHQRFASRQAAPNDRDRPLRRIKRSAASEKAAASRSRRLRVNRAALHEQAANRLRALIVQGDLAPGVPVNENDLSQSLGISRTPLREALKLLASEHLVELRPNRSAQIAPLHLQDIDELFEAVGGIERIAAEFAAQRITEKELQRLRALQDRMERFHETGTL